jgi:hypothetical protein
MMHPDKEWEKIAGANIKKPPGECRGFLVNCEAGFKVNFE